MTRKIVLGAAAFAFSVAIAIGFGPAPAWATAGVKVDCSKVMDEVHAGKKAKDIAKDLSISTSSVYKCKKKAGASASRSTAKGSGNTVSAAAPAAKTSPASK